MNPKTKKYIQDQKKQLVDSLKGNFSDISLYEDEIAEDEEIAFSKSKFSAFVLTMGDFSPTENKSFLVQDITIDYYSEQRDDLDEMILDIIDAVTTDNMQFVGTTKLRAKVKDTSRFVDVVSIQFVRKFKYGR